MDWSVLRHGSSASGPLSFLSSLPPLTHRLCFRHAAFVSLPPYTPLFHEDDRAAQLYVVLQGGLAVFMRGEEGGGGGGGGEDEAQQLIGCVRRGETVGAIGMLHGSDNMHGDRRHRRQAGAETEQTQADSGSLPHSSFHHRYGVSALTTVQTSLAVFDRSALSVLLSPSVGWHPPFLSLFSFLSSHPLLLPLSHFRLLQLAHAVRPMHFSTGEMLQLQGHDSDGVHLLMQGECELIREVEREEQEEEGQPAASPAAGARRVRVLVLGRAEAGELLGDCCLADGGLTASFVSVRASIRSCSLFVPKQLFTALMPRSALRAMREMEGKRRQARQERLQAMLSLLAPFVRLREVRKSTRRRSPMLAAYEARDREDRREGHRARERRVRAEMTEDGGSSGVVLADAISSQQELGAIAAEREQTAEAAAAAAGTAAGAAGRMEELQAEFQLLMRAKDGNVTRGFGVRKRWRWAISAAVYLLRAGMAFLLSGQAAADDAGQHDGSRAASFASPTAGSDRERWERQTGMRRRSSTMEGLRPRIRSSLITLRPRHSSVEQDASAPPSASPAASSPPPPPPAGRDSHYLHRRAISVNVALLSKADAAMAHIAQEEQSMRQQEEDDRQHLRQLMRQVDEEDSPLSADAGPSFTFLTATDDVEQVAAALPSAASAGSADSPAAGEQLQPEQQEAQAQEAEREGQDASAPVQDTVWEQQTAEEDDDPTSLAFLHSQPYNGRHVRLAQPLAQFEQQLEAAVRVAAAGAHRRQPVTGEEGSSAQSALAALWNNSKPVRAALSRASVRPVSPAPVPAATPKLELPSVPAPPSPPAGHACMRLALSSQPPSQETSRLPRRAEALFLNVFATAFSPPARSAPRVPLASLRAVQVSISSSFFYLSYYSTLLSTADVEHLVVKQLRSDGWEDAQTQAVDATSVCGAGLQLLWRRGAASVPVAGSWDGEQRLREEEQRQTDVQLQLLRTRDRVLLELQRLQPQQAAIAAADSAWQEETKEQTTQPLSTSPSHTTAAAAAASSSFSSAQLPPLLPPCRRQRKERQQWASPFALTEQSRAQEKLRRQERQLEGEEAETERQQRREQQAGAESDAAAALTFGGGIVRRRRLLTAEADVMTQRFDRRKKSMGSLLQQLSRRRQHGHTEEPRN